MKLRSLECLCEVVASGFNLSVAAGRLSASQPTLTRQIQMLEQTLGFEVLQRKGKKVAGLTSRGAVVHERALRMLQEARVLHSLPGDTPAEARGRIAIATTHFHAKYTLLEPVTALRKQYPKVTLALVEGDSASIPDMVAIGQVDIGLSVEGIEPHPDLVYYPCTELRWVVLMPRHHALAKTARPGPEQMAKHPLIVYGQRFGANRRVLQIFADRGLTPDIAMTTADVEVIKAYVAAGVGIAIVPAKAYEKGRDTALRATPLDALIAPATAMLTLQRGAMLRPYTRTLVQLLAPLVPEHELTQQFG